MSGRVLTSERRDRLASFFDAYRALGSSQLFTNVETFVQEWQKVAPRRRGQLIGASIDPDRLQTVFEDLTEPLRSARAAGRSFNPWTVAGLKRAEVRNAAVLATLWRPQSSGPSAIAFLNCFFRQIERQQSASLPSMDELAGGYMVRTEHCLAGEASERVDLTIEGKNFLVGVEVKIDAAEGLAQLDRYAEALSLRSRLKNKPAWLIFLAPYPHRGEVERVGLPVVDASWRDLIAATQHCLPVSEEYSFSDEMIDRFAHHVARF